MPIVATGPGGKRHRQHDHGDRDGHEAQRRRREGLGEVELEDPVVENVRDDAGRVEVEDVHVGV
jgi:hypothetical protein